MCARAALALSNQSVVVVSGTSGLQKSLSLVCSFFLGRVSKETILPGIKQAMALE